MSYEQVSKDLEKVIGYIHSDELNGCREKNNDGADTRLFR